MIDSNPEAQVTLMMRFETEAGSRTDIGNPMSRSNAALIADALNSTGHYAEFVSAGPCRPMAAHMKAGRTALRVANAPQANVFKIREAK